MEIIEEFELEVRRSFSRFSFHPLERKLYSHDISILPSFVEKFACTEADAIIQPKDLEEVKEILRLCKKYSKPVIPRGAATSGYGGVVPFRGGIVVDFSRMKRFEFNEDAKIAVSEPGAVWWDIQRAARKKGFSLRIYPTSALASTVGGWIAQGGIGVGSTRFGGIGENVEWLRVIDLKGEKRVAGEDLRFYIGMEGTTGLIVSSAIKLMDYAEEVPLAFDFKDVNGALRIIGKTKPYSAALISSEFFKIVNEVKGSNFEEKDTFLAVYLDKKPTLNGVKFEDGGEIWDERFYPLRIKKKSPSLVSVEILTPFERLENLLRELGKLKTEQAILVHFSKGEANVIVFIPGDERFELRKNWKKAFKILKTALKLGARPYATGLYLSHLSKRIMRDFDELYRFKREKDPKNLLNPGKVFPLGKLPLLMRLTQAFI
jgi:FAD/FMN-containing dehydrogenase